VVKPRVFITRRLPDEILARLDSTKYILDIWPGQRPPDKSVLIDRIADCDGLLCLLTDPVDAEVIAAAPKLRVISQMAVGVDNIDLSACAARGIPVGHTPGVLTEATADLTLALMLATCRRLLEAADDVRAGKWQTWEPFGWAGADLFRAKVGIVGMGRIGLAVTKRLRGFEAEVIYCGRRDNPEANALGARRVELDELLSEAEIISIHVPLTAETESLIDTAALKKMRKDAILINTARGKVVDQAALLDALKRQEIAAAGLDVTEPEPLARDHELLSLPNVIVLPHIGSASRKTRLKMAEIAVDNLIAGLAGKPLLFTRAT